MRKFFKQNWFLIFAIIYVISPIDILPEMFIPILGYTDDVGLLIVELIRRAIGRKSTPISEYEREIVEGAGELKDKVVEAVKRKSLKQSNSSNGQIINSNPKNNNFKK